MPPGLEIPVCQGLRWPSFQGFVLQIVLLGIFIFSVSLLLWSLHPSVRSSVNVCAGWLFWSDQPDQPFISEFPLIPVVPDNPSDMSLLTVLLACSVPVLLEERLLLGVCRQYLEQKPSPCFGGIISISRSITATYCTQYIYKAAPSEPFTYNLTYWALKIKKARWLFPLAKWFIFLS